MRAPTEAKVISARGGAGGFALVSQALIWMLGCTVFGAPWDASKATEALAAVPFPISALITAGAAWLGAQIAGYYAPHTSRPDLHEPVYEGEHEQPLRAADVSLDDIMRTAPIEPVEA